jgi:hypothetical protein
MKYELVLPRAFVHYLEGIHLIQTRDAQGDEDGVALLAAYDKSRSERGQLILTIDFEAQGRGVLNYLREYAELPAWAPYGSYAPAEKRAANLILERITDLNTRYREFATQEAQWRFDKWDQVRISYEKAPYRVATVVEDNGGDKVLVEWRSPDGPRVGRNVVAYYGKIHKQWIIRHRLTEN